ncbi:hypothetical protein MTO96_000723 [Rhipicephalus appendiculatus]
MRAPLTNLERNIAQPSPVPHTLTHYTHLERITNPPPPTMDVGRLAIFCSLEPRFMVGASRSRYKEGNPGSSGCRRDSQQRQA